MATVTAALVDWRQTDLYRFFALVFGALTHEYFDFVSQASARTALLDLWKCLECEGEFPGFEWFPSLRTLRVRVYRFVRCRSPEPAVPLFESAHNKSHPAQEIALENTYFYEVLELKSDSSRCVPDYLVTQLEFLAALRYTREHTSDDGDAIFLARAETEFLEHHLLKWVPTAKAKLDQINAPAFAVMMSLMV